MEAKKFTDEAEQRKWDNFNKLKNDVVSLFEDIVSDATQAAIDSDENQTISLKIDFIRDKKKDEWSVKTSGSSKKNFGKIIRMANVSKGQMSFLNPEM